MRELIFQLIHRFLQEHNEPVVPDNYYTPGRGKIVPCNVINV